MKSLRIVLVALAAVAILLVDSAPTAASPGATERVSVDSDGNEANGESRQSAISADGRYVAFASGASNLVEDDTNENWDVFVHDRETGATERVSLDSDGNEGNGSSGRFGVAISGDARYVAFYSTASNLVDGDTNGYEDAFVHDRQTGTTTRVNVHSDGDEANGGTLWPAISASGRYVAFYSSASNLVEGDTNDTSDIFVHDRQTETTERVSVDSEGNEGDGQSWFPAISGDGRYVAFYSSASNLVDGDTNGYEDAFVHDRQTGTTERVSVDSEGNEGDGQSWFPAISGDGRYVAFNSGASNLVEDDTNDAQDAFLHDRQTGTTERVSVDSDGNEGDGWNCAPALSAAGRYVAFWSGASNLVAGDTNNRADVFLRDRHTGTTERVSVDSAGNQGSGDGHQACDVLLLSRTGWPSVSADGRYVAFSSIASDLVEDDTNGTYDIFVHDRGPMAVGGTAQLPDVSDSSGLNYIAVAGLAAAAMLALTAGAWYARRRWLG
jgi:Tol biopolymer transport system component